VGFAITAAGKRSKKFRTWLRFERLFFFFFFFRPLGDFELGKNRRKATRRVCAVTGRFSMLVAQVNGRAQVGRVLVSDRNIHGRLKNGKPVTRTRTVQENEGWGGRWPGPAPQLFKAATLISGSRGLAQEYAERIKPVSLGAIKRYQGHNFLAGWLSEEYKRRSRMQAIATVASMNFIAGNRAKRGKLFLPGRHAQKRVCDHRLQRR